MRQFKTEKRLNKIVQTVNWRQPSLHVVIENVHDQHNVSAIFRSCDAVGVQLVSLLYTKEEFPKKISKVTSASAFKWVDKQRFDNVNVCYDELHKQGFKIYASTMADKSVSLYDLDLTGKVAVVLGNENRGISEEAAKLADGLFYIPMRGMVQSLNVSVAAAVTLYEAQRQRMIKGMYDESESSEKELDVLIDRWCDK